jgi:quinol monooxygenase YgiN
VTNEVVIVVVLTIKPGEVDRAEAALREMIGPTHREDGCLRYALHREVGNPNRLVIIERWSSYDALSDHYRQPHMKGMAELSLLLEQPIESYALQPVPTGDPAKGWL